jgi:starch-binding outer membrane protein SusE/F
MVTLLALAGCRKYDLAGEQATGEGIGEFALKTPLNNTNLVLNAGTPNAPLVIEWNAAKPGVKTLPSYRWIAALRSGSLDQPIIEIASDQNGTLPKLTLTQKALDDILKSRGIPDAAKVDLKWTVTADNGSTRVRATDSSNISVTRFGDGATPFQLLAPAPSLTPIAIDPGSTTQFLNFNWTKSNEVAGRPAIRYRVLFAERKVDASGNELPVDWSKPLFSMASNNGGVDTFARFNYNAINDSLSKYGFTSLSAPTELKWTVVATSGTWSQQADFINNISILREVRLFMAGSFQSSQGFGNDWTPGTGPELIRDTRQGLANNMYYTYIYLPANTEFKITQGRSWDVNYGDAGNGNISADNAANFKVAAAGVYRVSINRTTGKFHIMPGRMGFVGEAVTGVDWNPSAVFPTAEMKYMGRNKFLGVYTFKAGGWKMIDNDQWNNGSNAVDETRSYGSGGPSGSSLNVNGDNMPNITNPGTYRVIWDGSDVNNIKYRMFSGLRVVGAFQGWNPATAPAMTYEGNGVWKITIALTPGEFKFVSAEGWDFNYGGSGGMSGTISEGGGNINISTAGTYTITVDEYMQTYSII